MFNDTPKIRNFNVSRGGGRNPLPSSPNRVNYGTYTVEHLVSLHGVFLYHLSSCFCHGTWLHGRCCVYICISITRVTLVTWVTQLENQCIWVFNLKAKTTRTICKYCTRKIMVIECLVQVMKVLVTACVAILGLTSAG